MSPLTRDAILAADDRPRERVVVPEWGGDVLLAVMSGHDRDAWEYAMIRDRTATTDNIRARLVAACAIDESGEALFSEADVVALGRKSAIALARVFDVAKKLNRIGDDSLEETRGNSVPSRGDDSSSA